LASKQLGWFWRPVRCERVKGFGMLWSLAWAASPSKSTEHLKLDYRLEIALRPTMDLQHGFSCTMYWKLDDGILFQLDVRFSGVQTNLPFHSNLILRNIIQTFCFCFFKDWNSKDYNWQLEKHQSLKGKKINKKSCGIHGEEGKKRRGGKLVAVPSRVKKIDTHLL